VDAAKPGDWVLIWPGVYHENDPRHSAGVWITTPHLHILGINRSTVIIDGSHGSARQPCPSNPALQDLTPRDGIVVWNASGVSIENLTVCNYLAGPGGEHGSQIWWTGAQAADESPATSSSGSSYGWGGSTPSGPDLGLGAFSGSFLTTTSTYGPADIHSQHLAEFGIFVGGAAGPGQITNSYASNMGNAAFYLGACGQNCNAELTDDHGTNSAIGYLGTNSGGRITIKSSVFDDNRSGMVLLSLNTDDLPPPQDGRCPGTTTSCTVITRNVVADNNNADAPVFAINPPTGVGIDVSGGSYDTVSDNTVSGNAAWGVLIKDSLDSLSNQPQSHCQGGNPNVPGQGDCLFVATGNQVFGNSFGGNGTYRNPTNGDLAAFSVGVGSPTPRNCFYANRDAGGPLTSAPGLIQSAGVDGQPCAQAGVSHDSALLAQFSCATHGPCGDADARYPSQVGIRIIGLPQLPTMPDPCAGVPANTFCQALRKQG
jgi:parallel beta-helix repeat protein